MFCSSLFLATISRPYKLKKEIQLVSWIYDNKDKVNELIKEETKGMNQTQNIACETFPYPKEIIDDGINLNNIELLEVKQLSKIKRKIKNREKIK